MWRVSFYFKIPVLSDIKRMYIQMPKMKNVQSVAKSLIPLFYERNTRRKNIHLWYVTIVGRCIHPGLDYSESKYRCPLCDKVFYQMHAFDGHMNKHCNNRPIKCTMCKASFCYETALRKHMKALHTASKYSCEHCGHEFSQKCNLRDHINAKHVFDYVNRCNGCGKTFKYRSGLSRHRKIFNH